TTTATATCGSSAGAKAGNQACGSLSGEVCAVPVFPATSTPEIWAAWPVPDSTTETIISRSDRAVQELTARASASGLVRERTDKSELRTVFTRCGAMGMPSLALAAELIATSNGVTRTSNCPIELCANCGEVRSSGKVESETLNGCSRLTPNPKSFYCCALATVPFSIPRDVH